MLPCNLKTFFTPRESTHWGRGVMESLLCCQPSLALLFQLTSGQRDSDNSYSFCFSHFYSICDSFISQLIRKIKRCKDYFSILHLSQLHWNRKILYCCLVSCIFIPYLLSYVFISLVDYINLIRLLDCKMKLLWLWFGCYQLRINFTMLSGNSFSIKSMHIYWVSAVSTILYFFFKGTNVLIKNLYH